MTEEDLCAPGPTLRDPAYQDLCAFFATFAEGQARQLHVGDWVVAPPSIQPLLVVAIEPEANLLTVVSPAGDAQSARARADCVWLPTLDQLHILIRDQFGTAGFFSSSFNNASYWYTGQMLGMTITNMQPLAEGSSPQEAALKALLMLHQR